MSVRLRLAFAILALAFAAAASAAEVRPFVAGSMKEIAAARQGKPFVLGLWSLSCTHCREELALLGRLLKRHPGLDLVLVSTDSPAEQAAVAATLRQHGLNRAEAWVFADDFAERLRFEVDRKWRGELPRTYFYGPDGQVLAASGKPDPRQVDAWVREHLPHR